MKDMKTIKTALCIFAVMCLASCGSTRYAGSSSGTKISDIQEFAFLKPCAYMILYDTDGGYYNQNNTDIATEVITNVINSERFPFTDVLEADYQGEDNDTFEWVQNLMDIKQNQVSRLRVPKSLLKRLASVDNRYGILIYSRGYNMTQEAYDKERVEKTASKVIDTAAEKLIGIRGLTNPSQSYIPSDPYRNRMVCIVIDKEDQRVIYYAKEDPTFASHPKDRDDVSTLLHKLLKDFIR